MLTVRIPPDLRDAIDAVRGDVPRERWVRRVLEYVVAHGDRRSKSYDEAVKRHDVVAGRALESALGEERPDGTGGSSVVARAGSGSTIRTTKPSGSATPPRKPPASTRPPSLASAGGPFPGSAALDASRCLDCGKANGVHKGDCPAHPRAGR